MHYLKRGLGYMITHESDTPTIGLSRVGAYALDDHYVYH